MIYFEKTSGYIVTIDTITTNDTKNNLVEIVRCKDCKYKQCRYDSYFCINENGKCYGLEVTEDFYCADGKRRETECRNT